MTIAVSWAEFARKPSQFVNESEPVHITRADGHHKIMVDASEWTGMQETLAIMANTELFETIKAGLKDDGSEAVEITDDMWD
jgi:PHD/YefM family antitoxin component YafN of YafNO toxin-antitoxin module